MAQHTQNRKAGNFQGILQLRNPTKELIEWVQKTVAKDNKAAITFTTPVTGGVDMYFSSQKYLRALGKRIAENFKGELKSSRKLWTLDRVTSKEVYRVYVMFKLPSFKRGLAFSADGEKYKIIRVGKVVQVQNLKSGEKEDWKSDRVKKYFMKE